jgi:hypothetical protein
MAEIELLTSRKWAARAIVAYEEAGSTCDVTRLGDAIGCHNEAVEHGANVPGTWCAMVTADLAVVQASTFELFQRSLLVGDEPPEE